MADGLAPAHSDILSLLPTVATVIVAFGVAWSASRWALTASHREKIWERKSQAYSVIFDALFDLENWFRIQWDLAADDEMIEKRRLLYEAAKDRLDRTVAKEEWLLDKAVVQVFATMRHVLERRYEDILTEMVDTLNSVEATKDELVQIARRELLMPPRSFNSLFGWVAVRRP